MGVVVAFETKRPISVVQEKTCYFQSADEFLQECKRTLAYEDYADILCGIMDVEIYDIIDPELQDLVDTYYSFG